MFRAYLLVEAGLATATVDDLLRCLNRMERRGFDPDADRPRWALFLATEKERGLRSEFKKNVQVVNALQAWRGTGPKFPYPSKKRSVPKRLTQQQVRQLLAAPHANPLILLRNRALAAFALQTGMRRVEVARFNESDLNLEEHLLHIPRPAKGGLVRSIPLDPEFLAERGPFLSWLRARPRVESDPEAVWVSAVPGQATKRMTANKVGSLLTSIGQATGVPASFVRTRHTRATELLRRGVHVRYLQYYLGHSDLKSTMVYLEADEYDLKQEFDRLRRKRK